MAALIDGLGNTPFIHSFRTKRVSFVGVGGPLIDENERHYNIAGGDPLDVIVDIMITVKYADSYVQ